MSKISKSQVVQRLEDALETLGDEDCDDKAGHATISAARNFLEMLLNGQGIQGTSVPANDVRGVLTP